MSKTVQEIVQLLTNANNQLSIYEDSAMVVDVVDAEVIAEYDIDNEERAALLPHATLVDGEQV